MSDRQRPHVAWTAAVIGALALLSFVALRLWSGAEELPEDTPGSPQGQASPEPTAAQEQARREEIEAAVASASTAMDEARFDAARTLLSGTEAQFGWSESLEAASSRLELREASFRTRLRPIEFRIESIDTDLEDLYARFYTEGQLVFATETLTAKPSDGDKPAHRNIVVLRTSLNLGVSVELVEKGGLFSDDDVALGPVPINPLAKIEGGRMEFSYPDAPVRSLVVSYRISPFEPGLHLDEPLPPPPSDAPPSQLIRAVERALGTDQLAAARYAADRLRAEHKDHKDIGFIEENLTRRRATLEQNLTTATLTVLELSVDPRPDGDTKMKLWSSGGSAPSFKASIRTTDDLVLLNHLDDPLLPYTLPGTVPQDLPAGNRLQLTARGNAPLTIEIREVSPRFSTHMVGAVELPITLADLPEGSGTLVIERDPSVLVLPNTEPDRIRRLVLRWSVSR